jgi:hypothetical protein
VGQPFGSPGRCKQRPSRQFPRPSHFSNATSKNEDELIAATPH